MIGQRLEIKNTQKLVLSQALRQSLKILQMPVLELKDYLEEELEQNPMLEQRELLEKPEKESDTPTIEEWGDYLPRDEVNPGPSARGESASGPEKPKGGYSLEEHLVWQLRLSAADDADYSIGEKIISAINEDGYLTVSLEELCRSEGVSAEDAGRVLGIIQGFEPTGVGAKSLKECLLIQIAAAGKEGSLAHRIVSLVWEDFQKGRFDNIAAALKASPAEVSEAVRFISGLEPKPGREYSREEVRYIVPDVILEKEADGSWRIILNNQGMPSLRINRAYEAAIRSGKATPEEKKFLEEKFRSAIAVLRSIDERKKTLIRVTRSIIDKQKDFLEKGIEYLKPLTLKEVSGELGLHESTVSRVTANKYIQTPAGTFAFRHFFDVKLSSGAGESVSSGSVKQMIRIMIETEEGNAPLTDGAVASELAAKGIRLSRRTVAKYREEMKILAAGQRHRL